MLKLNKIIQIAVLMLLCSLPTVAQQNVEVDFSNKHQTIQGFGASDAWNADYVGKYWNENVKEDIAELLFSKDINGNNPKGIGLSRWRFNIGGGSAEQGSSSNIDKEERRSECFIESVSGDVANYNWNKQSGQQWFLKAANDYNVEQLVAFVNSPPRFYTKNGRANSNNSNRYGTTNLADGNYNKFSDFLVTVLEHFDDEGIEFSQISPINEPQYQWSSGQEGCPWKHDEVYTLIEKLDRDIKAKGLDTKILLSEAADYRYLTGVKDDSDKSDIIDEYFDPSSEYYMGDFSQMLPGIGGHSYWINGSDSNISSIRQTLRNKVDSYGDLEVYQTEYNLLNQFYDDKLTNAVFLAKIIYADLEIAGVSMWDYWTALERERWDQKNRFYLIRLIPQGGDYASLENSGTIAVDKNLWALGNFSRFIRPGYQRVNTSGANDLNSLMGVSFVAPDQSELVTVYTNWSDQSINVNQSLKNLPNGKYADYAEVYVTDASNDLQKASNHTLSNTFSVPKKSIVTFRIPILTEETTVSFTPDPNKTYYIDVPHHNLRLSANGESEVPGTTSTSTTGADVEWKFVAKGNGSWHIQRAAGGTLPRLRTDNNPSSDGTAADMQATSWSGTYTYFDFEPGAITGTHFITLPDGPAAHVRLQIDNSGNVQMVENTRNGTWESFKITEASGDTSCNWVTIANERQVMNFSGTKTIRYGANDVYVTKTVTGNTTCGNAFFGDPLPGVGKVCQECVTSSTSVDNIKLEAEDYDGMSGIQTEGTTDANGGENVGWIQNGDWLRFDDVNLTGLSNMDARVATKTSGGTLEVRLGSVSGTLIGSIKVGNTGDYQNWTTLNTSISNTSGTHDVYLVFTEGSGYLFNVNWIEFNNNSTANKNVIASAEVSNIKIYPNSVSSTATVENAAGTTLNVYDMNGREVFTKVISSESETINLSGLASGIYYGKMIGVPSKETVKIVKE